MHDLQLLLFITRLPLRQACFEFLQISRSRFGDLFFSNDLTIDDRSRL